MCWWATVSRRRCSSDMCSRATVELAGFMVAEHLLLPDTATRRDLTDDDLILGVAARVATPERLAALYLLAKADARATGPAAWTSWRQTLIRELVAKIQRVFERGQMGVEVAERLTDGVGRVRDLLANEPPADVERFVMRMPRSYFLSLPPAQIAAHYATIAPDLGRNDVRTASEPGPRPGTYELLVVAADRPGLLLVDRGRVVAGRPLHLDGAGLHDRGRRGRRPLRSAGRVRAEIGEERWREFRSLSGRRSTGGSRWSTA